MQIERLPNETYTPRDTVVYEDVQELLPLYDRMAFEANVILAGPKGIGKSASVAAWAARAKCPIVTFDCSEDVRRSQLLGTFILRGNETPFVLGPIPTAFEIARETGRCILLLEECNSLSPQSQKILNPVCDWRQRVEVPEAKRVFDPGKGRLWVVGTMNCCFHPDTEILTPHGVVPLEHLEEGDAVYSLNRETGVVEIDRVVRKWAEWSNRLVSIENQHVRLRMTPEHKMVVRSRHERAEGRGWGLRTVAEMAERTENQRPTDSYWEYPKPLELPEAIRWPENVELCNGVPYIHLDRDPNWLPKTNTKYTCRTLYPLDQFMGLLGWYISEGSLYSPQTGIYSIYLAQYNEVYRNEIIALLDKMEIAHTVQRRRVDETNGAITIKGVSFSNKVLFHALAYYGGRGSEHKFIHPDLLFGMPKKYLNCLFDTLYKGDGDQTIERCNPLFERTLSPGGISRRPRRYSTKSQQLYRAVLWMANYLGYTTTRHQDAEGMYRIGLRPAKPHTVNVDFEDIRYEGWVINVEVEKNRTICAGEDGRFLFVSNSVYGGVYELNEDLKSRFSIVPLDYPNGDEERRILRTVCPEHNRTMLDSVIRLAQETRQGQYQYALSTRDLVQLLTNIRLVGQQDALWILLGKWEDEDRATAKERILSIFNIQV